MKILYHHRIASKDGQFVHIDEICGAFRELGHDVEIVGPRGIQTGALGDQSRITRILKKYLPGLIYELLELAYSFVAFGRLVRKQRVFKAKILYERYSLFMLAGVWLKRKTGIMLVLEVNSPLAEERSAYGALKLRRIGLYLQGYVWRNADILLPVTSVLAKIIEEQGVPGEKIHVLHNGANLQRVEEAPSPEGAKYKLGLPDKVILGFVGFVREWHALERVLSILSDSTCGKVLHFLVIGDGPGLSDLKKEVATMGLENAVTFTGAVDRSEVLGYMAAFDIALQPAVVSYASPLKLFDYMAMAKAVVAPDTPNLREVLEDGRNALLFDGDNSAAFQDAVIRLVLNPSLRLELGNNARLTVLHRELDWVSNAKRITSIVNQMSDD